MRDYIELIDSPLTLPLMRLPNAFVLLSKIALNTVELGDPPHMGLQVGDAIIPSHSNMSMRESAHKAAIGALKLIGLITTRKMFGLNIARLSSLSPFQALAVSDNGPSEVEALGQIDRLVRIYSKAKGTGKWDRQLTRPAIPKAVRQRVLSAGVCALCDSTEQLQVDHIVPYSKGGAHKESNFQCLCWKCNSKKAAK